MLAVYCARPDPADPLAAAVVGDRRQPVAADGWTTVRMLSASLNMREITVLAGRASAWQRYPMILGSDGCGVLDDGTEVVVHSSVSSPGWQGPESLDPRRTVLSEQYQGTFAEIASVPCRNALPKPPELSTVDAACLSTAWLTAYRMLFVTAAVEPGHTVLVHGRRRFGSIASAAIALAHAAGVRVWAVGEPGDRDLALRLGAAAFFAGPQDLPAPVDAVLDASISASGWLDSAGALCPNGAIVCAGHRDSSDPGAARLGAGVRDFIFREVRLLGSGMGTAEDLARLMSFLVRTGLRPGVAEVLDIRDVKRGMRAMLSGNTIGKIVFRFP